MADRRRRGDAQPRRVDASTDAHRTQRREDRAPPRREGTQATRELRQRRVEAVRGRRRIAGRAGGARDASLVRDEAELQRDGETSGRGADPLEAGPRGQAEVDLCRLDSSRCAGRLESKQQSGQRDSDCEQSGQGRDESASALSNLSLHERCEVRVRVRPRLHRHRGSAGSRWPEAADSG